MNGFRPGLDGYLDVADRLSRYLRERARPAVERERATKRSLDSPGEFRSRDERVREAFLSSIGGLPDRPTDPAVETSTLLDREGYAVEAVVVESCPNFRVTDSSPAAPATVARGSPPVAPADPPPRWPAGRHRSRPPIPRHDGSQVATERPRRPVRTVHGGPQDPFRPATIAAHGRVLARRRPLGGRRRPLGSS